MNPIPARKMREYRATFQRRMEDEYSALEERREMAWELAHRAALLLKDRFGASQVIVFGSLVHGHWFSQSSDLDLAASGLKPEDYFLAVARLQDLSPLFSIDLVDLDRCRPELKKSIVQEGMAL